MSLVIDTVSYVRVIYLGTDFLKKKYISLVCRLSPPLALVVWLCVGTLFTKFNLYPSPMGWLAENGFKC